MGEINKNGVDVAIALLCELGRRGGTASANYITRTLTIPRSSFHRIARTLQESGVITLDRGVIRVGEVPRAIVQEPSFLLSKARAPLRARPAAPIRNITQRAPTGPIPLSAPSVRRVVRRPRLGFSNASLDNEWRFALVHAVEHAVARLGQAIGKLSVRHANDDADTQVAHLHALIDEGVDGLIVSAVDPSLISEPLERAHRNGVPVVLVDRAVGPNVPYHSLVWADNEQIGRVHALWLAEKLGGRGSIVMLGGKERALPARRRFEAAREMLTNFPELDVLEFHWTDWHREEARLIMDEAIANHGDRIGGVWCDSGLQGSGSMEAFIAAGASRGRIPPHTGGDLNLAYKLAITHRIPLAALDYPPAMGVAAVEVLQAALRGQWVPKTLHVASETILTRGQGTRSIRATLLAEEHVRWDLPDDLVLASGLGDSYDPTRFRVHYPGNRYNRSAADLGLRASA